MKNLGAAGSLSISAAAAEVPHRPALIEGEKVHTFAGLLPRVRGAQDWLRSHGLEGPDSGSLAMVGTASLPRLVMLYGALELGVPIVFLHPRWSAGETRRCLEESGAQIVLGAEETMALAGAMEPSPGPVEASRPLGVLHTSGSQGRPRGVVLSRRAALASAEASAGNLGWRPEDRWLASLSIAHVGGLMVFLRCLIARRTVVVPEGEGGGDAAELMARLERHRVTLLSLVPTQLRRCLDGGGSPPPSVRAVLLGGAAASESLVDAGRAAGWPLLTTYGMTEACSQVATQGAKGPWRGRGHCGPPLGDFQIRLGPEGEIELRGEALLSAYLPPPTRSPWTEDGWFRTGDLGRLDGGGHLYLEGRADDVIITGGENVHPREVEEALEKDPTVSSACVFGVPDEHWGQRVAVVWVAAGPRPRGWRIAQAAKELTRFKRPRLAAEVEHLILNPTGKVDRRANVEAWAHRLEPLPQGDPE